MSSKPYFKLYFSDLAGDTLGLSDAEMGSYVLLLGAMWNAGGALSLDPRSMSRIARVSVAKWPSRWARLKPFFVVYRQSVTHKRLTEERKKVAEISQTNSENGKAGAEAKRLKSLKTGEANASRTDKRTRSHTIGHRESPKPPVGAFLVLKEWEGPSEVRAIVAAHLFNDTDAILARFTWRELPEKALVTASPTMLDKLKPCEAELRAAGWALIVEKASTLIIGKAAA